MIKKEEKKIVYHVEYGIIPARFLSNKNDRGKVEFSSYLPEKSNKRVIKNR